MPSHMVCLYTMNLKQIAVRIPAEIDARLESLAGHTGRSKTFYIREAILDKLEDLEDLYLAEQRLIAFRASKAEATPLEAVMKQYGLES